MFEVLKNSGVSDERFNKIVPVCGDIAEEKLGLSDDDLNALRDNVHIVVHSAATLDFETDLKTAVLVNLIGTKRVVDLCKEIKNLRVSLPQITTHYRIFITAGTGPEYISNARQN